MVTSRERITRLFEGKDIDRIPIWLLAPFHKVGYYADIYNLECYKPIVNYIDKYCETFNRRSYGTGFLYSGNKEIIRTSRKIEKDGNVIIENTIKYKDIELKAFVSKGKDGTKQKKFIEDPEDLIKIADIPYVKFQPDFSPYIQEKEELGDKGVMMMDLGDPLGPLNNLLDIQDFSMFTITDYDKIVYFLDAIYERTLDVYKTYLENNIGEIFFIVGCEYAGPPLVSPDKFNELSVRYVKGIVDLVRSYGKKSIVHYHGNLRKILNGVKGMNPDGLHTIEAPPIGDCTITQAREVLGKDMVLIGNIQYDDITRLDPAEIDEMVKETINQGKSGRFILSPYAGPYEEYISDKTVKNYLTFIEAGLKYGKLN